MLTISVSNNLDPIIGQLDAIGRKQLPFAASRAINTLAGRIQGNITAAQAATLDRPSAFTQRAWRIARSSKASLEATVSAQPLQARYLRFAYLGGHRRTKGVEYRVAGQTDADSEAGTQKMVPTRNVRLDSAGNVSQAALKAMQARLGQKGRRGTFLGKPRGGGANANRGIGLYERMGRRVRLLMVFTEPKPYRQRVDMVRIANTTYSRHFDRMLKDALEQAISTAKR